MAITQKITQMLWFDTNAEEAARFYVSVFKNSRILSVTHYSANMHLPEGTVMTVAFELEGQQFTALNGGPHAKFNEAISMVVTCKDQAEVDSYWQKLTADGGAEVQCGWLKDKFGLSWQVVPAELWPLIEGPRSAEVMQAVMRMVKLDIAELKAAAGR
ncbi:MAG TPA: VOC family protein [Phycisphaerales bacterium]|nr:VOC family protein [Phycisphaerales bacterium]